MKKILSFISIAGITVLFSCGGAETKVDTTDTMQTTDTTERVSDEKVPVTPEPRNGSVDKPANNNRNGAKNDILANIDRHLISTIQGDNVTVENTLPDATFQRAIVEISEVTEAGQTQKTNFYTLINIEPGSKKSVKITSSNTGAKLVAHIVKAKSDQLTNGEMILVGSRYSPQ